MPLLQRVVKGIGSGIGLASEAIADHKEKKVAKEPGASPLRSAQLEAGEGSRSISRSAEAGRGEKERVGGEDGDYESDSDSDSSLDMDSSDLDNDKAEWALDDAAQQLEAPPPTYDEASSSSPASADELASAFLNTHQVARDPKKSYQPLPCPVILPQRRPKDKSRGFVRAYAPVLDTCSGIDQATFIDFLNGLDRASRASPVFDVVNLACFAVGFVPSPIAMGVSIAVQVASRTAQEVQSRHRRNTYLDQINETLFKPRGLYCMIMTFKPDSPHEPIIGMDVRSVDQALAKATSNPESEMRQKLKTLRLSSGATKGEMSLPESAPLIYPALEAALDRPAEMTPAKQNALKSSTGFVASYLDRRAQAAYAGMYPDSKLALAVPPPDKKFASRFSDPNHPANSGSLLALLTGGKFDPKAKKRGRRAQRRARRRGYELSEADIKNAEMGRLPRRRQGVIRRVLQQHVLYLTIVNLPTESEMKEMLQELDRKSS
ncbi:hypothetical protein A1O3_04419 [Capronia epimyces CBS 606.96]|uniref:Ras modification protein ERF4 n=1 Tax=Capronia epimyces CBS 606.96 TaxID=1182542 RepID=W9YYU0_9EURO|nr:uncharacterized protein A1O3_04419 [Capronia epimyces CBS 606.96]EXJ87459.1 hypothetical protein A1O3_04419 [Capronia epimyces CBS 606.96]